MGAMDVIRGSIEELDRVLGTIDCGRLVSGNGVSRTSVPRTGEDRVHMTERVLVVPMLDMLGYRRDASEGRVVVVTATMNSPLDAVSMSTIGAMHTDRVVAGIGTDGFRWLLVKKSEGRVRVSSVHDLREYYLEALEDSRFGVSVRRDRSGLELFETGMARESVLECIHRSNHRWFRLYRRNPVTAYVERSPGTNRSPPVRFSDLQVLVQDHVLVVELF